VKAHRPIFTSGPWRPADGDPDHPARVLGIPVAEHLATRPDGGGALVRLTDRRYALTSSIAVVGPRRKLERYLHRCDRAALGDEWFEQLSVLLRRRPDGKLAGVRRPA
jgi:hypothetical protein